jgi:hypothetical protein
LADDEGQYTFYTTSSNPKRSRHKSFRGPAICVPTVSATGHGHASIKSIHLAEGDFDAASITAVLVPKEPDVAVAQIYYYLLAHKDELLVPLLRGATNKSLSIERLEALEIPIFSDESEEATAVAQLVEQRLAIKMAELEAQRLRGIHEASIDSLRRFSLREH